MPRRSGNSGKRMGWEKRQSKRARRQLLNSQLAQETKRNQVTNFYNESSYEEKDFEVHEVNLCCCCGSSTFPYMTHCPVVGAGYYATNTGRFVVICGRDEWNVVCEKNTIFHSHCTDKTALEYHNILTNLKIGIHSICDDCFGFMRKKNCLIHHVRDNGYPIYVSANHRTCEMHRFFSSDKTNVPAKYYTDEKYNWDKESKEEKESKDDETDPFEAHLRKLRKNIVTPDERKVIVKMCENVSGLTSKECEEFHEVLDFTDEKDTDMIDLYRTLNYPYIFMCESCYNQVKTFLSHSQKHTNH